VTSHAVTLPRDRYNSASSEEKTSSDGAHADERGSSSNQDDDTYDYESDSDDRSHASETEELNHSATQLQLDEGNMIVTEHPVQFETMEEARAVLDGLENARFSVHGNGIGTTILVCTSHVACPASVGTRKLTSRWYLLCRGGIHTAVPVPRQEQMTGIHKPFLQQIDNLLLGGQGPKKSLTTLQTTYQKPDEKLALLPSVSQLKNRAYKLQKHGDFKITAFADVMEWAAPIMCTSKSQFYWDS
jgi:hypothetical protein